MLRNESRPLAFAFFALVLCSCHTREKPVGSNQTSTPFDEVFRRCATKNVDGLIAACADRDNIIRRMAVASLSEIADKQAAEQLRKSLTDTDDFARESAAHGLGVIKDNNAVPALKKLLNDPAVEVRNAAAWSLAEMKQLENAMVERLGADRDPAKEAAVRLFNPIAQMRLVAEHVEGYNQHVLLSLSPTEPMISEWSERAGRDQIIRDLNAALENQGNLVSSRLIAAHSLVALRTTDANPLLRVVKRKDNWPVQLKCLAVLGALQNKTSVMPLVELINTSEDLKLRSQLANTLGHLGDSRAVPALMEVLAGAEYVQARPIRPSMFDYQGTTVWRKLKKDIQISAATALGRIGDPKAETILRVFADSDFRKELSKKRDPSKPVDVIYLAFGAADEADDEVRKTAREALAKLRK